MERRGRQEYSSPQSVLSALPFNSCVNFGKSLKLSEPPCPHLIPALLNLKGWLEYEVDIMCEGSTLRECYKERSRYILVFQ